ncbi:hypothetical protein NIES4071_22330 [Calothrix sp. NIES-4071]|nr:hypothetical protein NIES4071_22330 [Calothrix sp. NIES-4071]BAZ56565.1 hypothetical protein NIES4105_22280 [Calothrix sp. NIES-4105]
MASYTSTSVLHAYEVNPYTKAYTLQLKNVYTLYALYTKVSRVNAEKHKQNEKFMDAETKPSNRMIFVHADLDLYGLNPYEFRLYAHIARRGQCFSSLETMAKICKMSVRKAQYALKNLQEQGMVQRKKRQGRTDVYELTPRSQWKQPEDSAKLEQERQKVKVSLAKLTKAKEVDENNSIEEEN